MNPLCQAFELYDSLISDLATEISERDFGGIADPSFEGVRFYSFDRLAGNFDYELAVELGAEKVDEIEDCLMRADRGYSLFPHILSRLKTVAPLFNKNGKAVFLGTWGMGPGEIGWSVRYLNDRDTFESFLRDALVSEVDVDIHNDAFLGEIRRTDYHGENNPSAFHD